MISPKIENEMLKVQCIRCGNCCPKDCGYLTYEINGIANCLDHSNNNQRVGCWRPPIFHHNAGIACNAIEKELLRKGQFIHRPSAQVPSGQVYYTDTDSFRILTARYK